MRRFLFVIFCVLLLITSIGTRLPGIAVKALKNASLVRILKTPACDPNWFVCKSLLSSYPPLVFDGNKNALIKAKGDLLRASEIESMDVSVWLRLAEIEFALENRGEAAKYLTTAGTTQSGRSPLLQDDHYEAQLVRAYLSARKEEWEDSVYHYRLGLSWGDERVLEKDQSAYLYSLARYFEHEAGNSYETIEKEYLSVKYLIEADALGEAQEKVEQLRKRLEKNEIWAPKIAELTGRISEKRGDFQEAVEFYESALAKNPDLRIAILRLLNISDNVPDTIGHDRLESNGPHYRLGAHGKGYQVDQPVNLENGWTLLGYDLDEDLFQQAHFLDIWLWWEVEGKTPVGEDWIKVGKYWIQKQRVVNLFPNAGFEWGSDEKNIPLGYDREVYGVQETNYGIDSFIRNEKETNTFFANNNSGAPDIGLVSRSISVNADSYYLMSGWIWDQGSNSNLGRNCFPEDPDHMRQYFLADGHGLKPFETWVHFSGLAIAYVPKNTTECKAFLSNNQSDYIARWDDVLWTRISLNQPDEKTRQ